MLFRDSASAVAAERLAGSLFVRLIDQFVHKHGHKPSPSEVRSWELSFPALTNALLDAGLGMVEVLLEYSLSLNSKRADVVLAGVHPGTGEPSCVVVELKQWSSALPEDGEPLLCRVDAYTRPVLNPIEQVRGASSDVRSRRSYAGGRCNRPCAPWDGRGTSCRVRRRAPFFDVAAGRQQDAGGQTRWYAPVHRERVGVV
ncbi:hypothetical protein GCM10010440_37560 [Kitasatospora cinereorecta]